MSDVSETGESADEDPRRGAPPEVVGPYLAKVLGEDAWSDCEVTLVAGGKSNLTYVISSLAGEVVLRRPPLAAVLPTAHDMVREHRVISALADTDVPVPRVFHLCADTAVVGAPFYVMERINGLIVRDTVPAGYADSPEERSRITDVLVDTLIAIHRVPIDGPLEGYGRTDGYLARQIKRWIGQWEASKEALAATDFALEDLDRLATDLSANLPAQRETSLVHGDFRLDNTMLDPQDPGRILAVLDWELSTLGDPLADVGIIGVYWGDRNAPPNAHQLTSRVTLEPGFPSRIEVFRRYGERSGRDISALPWYLAFGYFKLAVISTGIAARHQAGGMIGEGFDTAAATVPGLVGNGRRMLDEGLPDSQ
jgi:aminoglycoside phosphotransferase (APT) family kinase protein